MSNNTRGSRNNVYLNFNYKRFYLVTLLLVICGALLDWTSTYLLIKEYPTQVRETNIAIRELIDQHGPGGVFLSWQKLTLSYIMMGLIGSLLIFFWFTRLLPISRTHKIWVTIAMGMQLMVIFVYGAGVSNFLLYFAIKLGLF